MDYYTSVGLIKCVDKYPVDSEASEVLPCPHCGKRPDLFVVRTEDEAVSNMLDAYWIRAIRLGMVYYRIECCTIMEGTDWEKMRNVWNSRIGKSKSS